MQHCTFQDNKHVAETKQKQTRRNATRARLNDAETTVVKSRPPAKPTTPSSTDPQPSLRKKILSCVRAALLTTCWVQELLHGSCLFYCRAFRASVMRAPLSTGSARVVLLFITPPAACCIYFFHVRSLHQLRWATLVVMCAPFWGLRWNSCLRVLRTNCYKNF